MEAMSEEKTNPGLFSRMKEAFAPKSPEGPDIERRASKRVGLSIPVMVQAGDSDFKAQTLKDLGLLGLSISKGGSLPKNSPVKIQFGAYEGISEAFLLQTQVCRLDGEEEPLTVCVTVDRE